MSIPPREILASGAAALGVALDSRQLDLFDRLTSLLLEWNARFNLTRIVDPAEIAVKHYLDSLSVLSVLEVPDSSLMIDVGSGAGFPGIPLKIALPDLRLTLLDSVRKKLEFTAATAEELGLSNVEFVHARAEDAGRDGACRERFDFAVSRAVARLSVLAEFCIPFCRAGGWFVAYKGPHAEQEAREGAKEVRALGGEIEGVHALTLPHSDLGRTLMVVRKARPTPARYPRKAGTPERAPIA